MWYNTLGCLWFWFVLLSLRWWIATLHKKLTSISGSNNRLTQHSLGWNRTNLSHWNWQLNTGFYKKKERIESCIEAIEVVAIILSPNFTFGQFQNNGNAAQDEHFFLVLMAHRWMQFVAKTTKKGQPDRMGHIFVWDIV